MVIKARELQPGQVIRVEYGDYGNWQKFCVEKVRPSGSKVVADVCSSGGYSFKTDFSFRMDEEVDVVERDVKISRNAKGDGVIKIDSDAADLLEKLLRESDGELSVRELASALIRYAANDTIIKIEDEEG